MKTFKDQANRLWTVSINCWSIRQVEAAIGVHIPSLIDDGFRPFAELIDDSSRLADVVWHLCRDDAEKLGVSEADFLKAMYGDALDSATTAFREEFVDFFRNPDQRAVLGRAMVAMDRVKERLTAKTNHQLDNLDLESMVEASIGSAGGSPESSASTPDHSPIASSP